MKHTELLNMKTTMMYKLHLNSSPVSGYFAKERSLIVKLSGHR